jgi:hypothetical protein
VKLALTETMRNGNLSLAEIFYSPEDPTSSTCLQRKKIRYYAVSLWPGFTVDVLE